MSTAPANWPFATYKGVPVVKPKPMRRPKPAPPAAPVAPEALF